MSSPRLKFQEDEKILVREYNSNPYHPNDHIVAKPDMTATKKVVTITTVVKTDSTLSNQQSKFSQLFFKFKKLFKIEKK